MSNLTQLLNKNLANLQVMYVKLHNFHWNVKGYQFRSIHGMTEEYYNHFAEVYDEVAERILQLGEKPLVTMKDYLSEAVIKEDNGSSHTPEEVLSKVAADFEILKKEFKHIEDEASKAGDSVTEGLATENIGWFEKELWMIESSKN